MTMITISAQDGANGPLVPIASSNGTPILGLETFFPGGHSQGVVDALIINGSTYEFAANDVSNTVPDTLNLFATFQGIVAPSGQLTLPSIMQTSEFAASGWVISQQVFVSGQIVGTHTDTGLSTIFPTFAATAGAPYTIVLELQFVSNGITAGDYGAAVLTTPTTPMMPVPGPIAGEGIVGLLALAIFIVFMAPRRGARARCDGAPNSDGDVGGRS